MKNIFKNNEKNTVLFFIISLILLIISLLFLNIFINPIQSLKYKFSNQLFSINYIQDSHYSKAAPKFGNLGLFIGDGKTNDFKSDYYIVHDFGFIGKQVNKAKIGDNFKLKGSTYKIIDSFKFKKGTYLSEIKDRCLLSSNDKKIESACIQVCIPNSNYNKMIIAILDD